MAKKNFDSFINSAGKKPKPTPEEVEAMAKQLHQPSTAPLTEPMKEPVKAPATNATKTNAPVPVKPKASAKKAPTPPKQAPPARSARNSEAPREKVRITIDLAKDLYKRMKLSVVQNETDISTYIRELIENDLAGR